MKKILLFAIMLIALSAVSIAGVDRTTAIRTGYTMPIRAMTFTAADSIVTSDSLVITITNLQKYLQHQTITTTLTKVDDETSSVLITLRGRATSTDDWHPIGTAVTWVTSANNPAVITSTSPLNYNYLMVSYVASAAASQHLQVATFAVKTTNVYSYGGNLDLGAGYDLIGSSTSDITMHTNKFTVAGATGNTVIAGTLNTTGTIDNIVTNTVAGGDKGLNAAITQSSTALTGNLIGAGIVATNGTTAAAAGVIYGIEAKARAADPAGAGNTIGRLTGVYASVDAKAKTATTMRAFEASLDGAAGGTSTEAVAFEAFNNSSATQTSSYAFSANGGTAGGHKAYTADLRLQNGALINNSSTSLLTITEATVAVAGNLTGSAKITAADSLCLGTFRFLIRLDTLCSVKGTDTLRIHPKR